MSVHTPGDVLAYIEWVWFLQWRAGLALDYAGAFSFDEIAATIGVEAPKLTPGDCLPDELATAQLYWPLTTPRRAKPMSADELCDCGHGRASHEPYDSSLGDNVVVREQCVECSCIDFQLPENEPDPMTTPGRQAAIEAAVRELSHDRVTKPHVLDPDREARLVIDAYERVLAEQPRERVTHGRHCPCSACAAQDWSEPQLAACGMHGPSCPPVYAPIPRTKSPEQPEGEAVLRVEWLHEEFENRSSPMVWPKCGPASATHRRLVSDWMPIVRSAK